MVTPEQLRANYGVVKPRADRLKISVLHEVEQLLAAHSIPLGVPLEARVKSWSSLEEKLERKALALTDVSALDDLVGLRAILLFRSDLVPAIEALSKTFKVLSSEDTAARLGESQFGYQSQHLVVQLPSEWASIPSLKDLTDLRIEIQVRTIAQHIWAAASHKLQYKQEQSVPPPLRRTIYRISALLETVDLELDRVLEERSSYAAVAPAAPEDQRLDVDLLASMLDAEYPAKNKTEAEDYSDLLADLFHWKVDTAEQLRAMIRGTREAVMKEEASRVKEEAANLASGKQIWGTTKDRISAGIFFAHSGLARNALRHWKGETEVDAYLMNKFNDRSKPPQRARARKKTRT